jgi:hypothetical protein
MTSVNANVQGILADLDAKRDAGELDGYSAKTRISCPLSSTSLTST